MGWLVRIDVFYFDVCTSEEVDAVFEAVVFGIDHSLDTSLDDEFGTFDAGRGCDVEGGSVAGVVGARQFCDGIGFGMEYIGFCDVVIVFAYVFEAGGSTIVAIGDDGFVLHDECTDLATFAVGVFCPDACHADVAEVETILFEFLLCHERMG